MSINDISQTAVQSFAEECKIIQRYLGHDTMQAYQQLATRNANYPGKDTALGLIYIAGKLAGEAGELVQEPFKAMRDDDLMPVYDATIYQEGHATETPHSAAYLDGKLTDSRRARIIKEAGGVLWYLSALAGELGITLSDIALANLTELAGRTERGTLQGEGER